jgi:MoaA/NifB/PqqE/SkfB family radical SAM enzyme
MWLGVRKPQRTINVPVELARFAKHAISSKHHPLLAQLVVTRRCNLSCSYCNEYDHSSEPVNLDTLATRIQHLARLRTRLIACTGGEPLLHHDIGDIIAEIRRHGMVAMLSTNGYRLTEERIDRLNEAGLQVIQISIDNITPDARSQKSLQAIEDRLELLARRAQFRVNINTVLGSGEPSALDAVEIARRALHYGFSHSVGLLHNETGALRPLTAVERSAYRCVGRLNSTALHRFNYWLFQRKLIAGKSNGWTCRAGARFLYVCEFGLVHWCSQRRGCPGIPLEEYSQADIALAFKTAKSCSPTCTLTCVHHVSAFDIGRARQIFPDSQGSSLTAQST